MSQRHQTPVSSFRAKREIFVIRGEGLTFPPHVPRTSPLSSSVFHPARTLSGSFRSPPFFPRRESCVLVSLSSQWGKAVLSLSALETHFPTLFHTASALSAPTGHLPLRGRLTIRGKPVIADFRASPHIYLRRSRHHKFESRLFLLPIYEAS